VTAFWRGNFVNCLKIVPEQGIRLSCADAFKRRCYGVNGKYNDNNVTLSQRFTAGAFGGICGQVSLLLSRYQRSHRVAGCNRNMLSNGMVLRERGNVLDTEQY
jgi:hypothetical protein